MMVLLGHSGHTAVLSKVTLLGTEEMPEMFLRSACVESDSRSRSNLNNSIQRFIQDRVLDV
jgi:hypothetical protein